jgi:hypothetical protein
MVKEDQGPPMATIDEDLGQFERDIRQLKIEYDQYFGGGRKRPPTEIEWRIELLVKRYGERGGELKFAQQKGSTQRRGTLPETLRRSGQSHRGGTRQSAPGAASGSRGCGAAPIARPQSG